MDRSKPSRPPPKHSGDFVATRPRLPLPVPTSEREFRDMFADEGALMAAVAELRWSDGFRCVACDSQASPSRLGTSGMRCVDCDRWQTPLTGTLLHGRSADLRRWFELIWLVAARGQPTSLTQVAQRLHLASLAEAGAMLARIRPALVRVLGQPLRGRVGVSCFPLRFTQRSEDGVHRIVNASIAVAQELDCTRPRVRVARVAGPSSRSMQRFVLASVEAGADVTTAGWSASSWLRDHGFRHLVRPGWEGGEVAAALMESLGGVAGGSLELLAFHLDEAAFRTSFPIEEPRDRGRRFLLLLALAAQPYAPELRVDLALGG